MKDQRLYLGHIREAIADIRTYASAGEGAFFTERMRQDAIIRKLEVIGEAVKQLSDETRLQQPAIPWRQIAGMRDHLTHAYFGSSSPNNINTLQSLNQKSTATFHFSDRVSSRA